jgi:ferredoxin
MPFIDTNVIACHLCDKYPCIEACQENALLKERVTDCLPYFGYGEIDFRICTRDIYHDNCKLCIDECPVENAFKYRNNRTSSRRNKTFHQKQALEKNKLLNPKNFENFLDECNPIQINKDYCIGCGLCIEACPTYPKSIRITLIRDNTK